MGVDYAVVVEHATPSMLSMFHVVGIAGIRNENPRCQRSLPVILSRVWLISSSNREDLTSELLLTSKLKDHLFFRLGLLKSIQYISTPTLSALHISLTLLKNVISKKSFCSPKNKFQRMPKTF